ncbi:MAG: ABC transporter ATP-binding protein [Ruminococcaceae bacterium]|nr:ABC transporter ATP-binding protein [Oscillospiraceae bacterium]
MAKRSNNPVNDCVRNFTENKGHPFKIMLGFYKGEGWTLVKSTLALTFQQLPVWVIPIVTTEIINAVTYQNKPLSYIILCSVIAFISIFQNAFSTFAVSKVYDKLVRRIEYSLRYSIIEKLQQLSMSYHKNVSSGRLQSKIMRDSENVEAMLASLFRHIFFIVTNLAIAITVTIKNSPIVMLFFVFVVPCEILLLRVLGGHVRKRNRKFRTEMEETQSDVSEMLELIPVTRAHGLQKREVNRMNRRLGSVMDTGYHLDKTNSFFGAGSWVLMELSSLACLTFTGIMAYQGKISVGEVVLYRTYFAQIVASVNTIINLYPQLTKGAESINSISEVLNEENIETDNSIIPLPDMKGGVTFQDVCYKYADGDRWILNNFNVKVAPGESIAFVGGSGAGKSTILNLLIGFDRPQEGQILIDRVNMMNLDMAEYRSQIAVVPQNTILFSGTVKDNITYGLDNVSDEQVMEVLQAVGLDELVDNMPLGMHTQLGEHGGKLSGGQRQRISIARALLRNPKIIIFDEATSALDSASEKKVQAAVDNMMKKCTTFLVAHRLSTIKNADRIAVVNQGTITEIGTYDELMAKKGEFYELKKLQD